MKKEHKYALGAFVVGLLVYHFLTFATLYQEQPKEFNCNRAAQVCGLSTGGIDSTPYASCDSCCDNPPETGSCDGRPTGYYSTGERSAAVGYCSAYQCSTGSCGVEWVSTIAMQGWQCACIVDTN